MKATAGETKVRETVVGGMTLLHISRHRANRTKILNSCTGTIHRILRIKSNSHQPLFFLSLFGATDEGFFTT